jgi:hypothetical protein
MHQSFRDGFEKVSNIGTTMVRHPILSGTLLGIAPMGLAGAAGGALGGALVAPEETRGASALAGAIGGGLAGAFAGGAKGFKRGVDFAASPLSWQPERLRATNEAAMKILGPNIPLDIATGVPGAMLGAAVGTKLMHREPKNKRK